MVVLMDVRETYRSMSPAPRMKVYVKGRLKLYTAGYSTP